MLLIALWQFIFDLVMLAGKPDTAAGLSWQLHTVAMHRCSKAGSQRVWTRFVHLTFSS